MNKLKLITLLIAMAAWMQTGDACTVIVAGKKATADGSVLNSHTDCGADCRIQVVPGQKYPKGTTVPVCYG
ncbi:MAG: peptidase, partial [Tannerellaceae bacterium]